MEIIAYTDRLSARPGEEIRFYVSTTSAAYDVAIVRHNHFFDTPNPARDTVIPSSLNPKYEGRQQPVPIGSYTLIEFAPALRLTTSFTIQTWIYATIPQRGHAQGIVSKFESSTGDGYLLQIDASGHLAFQLGVGERSICLAGDAVVIAKRWYSIGVRYDAATQLLQLDWSMLKRLWLPEETGGSSAKLTGVPRDAASGSFLIGAAELAPMSDGRLAPVGAFNGKIERCRIWDRALSNAELSQIWNWCDPSTVNGLVANWDPSIDIISTVIKDCGPHGFDGVIVNQPARAVTGANFDGSEVTFRLKPEMYGAVAYHEDDLEDAGWTVDFVYEVPADLPSGLYAARMQAGDSIEYIPFYIRPVLHESGAAVLFLAPTNTYLAYANERLFKSAELDPEFLAKTTDLKVKLTERERWLDCHPELGSSVYDTHPDGTGICYSSRLRPIVTMRPQFKLFINGCPRHFSADLFLIEWLEQNAFKYDVAIDEDVHREGVEALKNYKVVITGSHPEYWTSQMLRALTEYLAGGGRLMYLGGNGFYWVTAIAEGRPHLIEVRRGINGTRTSTSEPGETGLSFTGEQGGLWRYRGLAPNQLVGIGFASEGWGGAEGYDQLPGSRDPRAAWVFEGIGSGDVIGDFGLIMGGAAGDEIDRFDLANGSPSEVIRLATSQGRHTNYYQIVIEDLTMVLPGHGGQEDLRVRSDITLLEAPNGGAVFSVGSINWSGSLLTNAGDNNVSLLTRNVLRRFSQK